jgi:hypothetical protein
MSFGRAGTYKSIVNEAYQQNKNNFRSKVHTYLLVFNLLDAYFTVPFVLTPMITDTVKLT